MADWPKATQEQPDAADRVLSHIRRAKQSISLTPVPQLRFGQSKLARICEQLCGYFGRETDGLIQVYQEGFFDLEGQSLFPRSPKHHLKTS